MFTLRIIKIYVRGIEFPHRWIQTVLIRFFAFFVFLMLLSGIVNEEPLSWYPDKSILIIMVLLSMYAFVYVAVFLGVLVYRILKTKHFCAKNKLGARDFFALSADEISKTFN